MTSERRAAVNRQNARKSTGPRTRSGKARSSQNALRHGLTAERVVLPGEDPVAFEAFRSDLVDHFQPADPVSEHLVEHVVACIWRLRRVPEIEAKRAAEPTAVAQREGVIETELLADLLDGFGARSFPAGQRDRGVSRQQQRQREDRQRDDE